MNDNKNKFHFVTEDELKDFLKNDNDTTKSKKTKEEKVELKKESSNDKNEKTEYKFNNRPYFSFEVRVILMLLGILILFAISCFFIVKTVKLGSNEIISYNETSIANYKVCLKENNIYQDSCISENMQYVSSLVNNISTSFQYDATFSDTINYKGTYSVIGLLEIYDANEQTKSLLKQEEVLVNKTKINDKNKNIHLSTKANIDYSKYNNMVEEYKQHYNLEVTANLKVILFVDNSKENRNVAYINIPLGSQTFNISKSNISNSNQKIEIIVNRWNKDTIFYGSIATFIMLLSLFLLYKMTRLVLKVTNNHNKYQTKLSQILREYDRIIVVARDGYESNVTKKVIKVKSFDELLDARETLEKPIIYSKVNSIKSEFIVEDESKLYKYVLKEVDI